MANSIRLRAVLDGDEVTIRALISHPMETGQRKDPATGEAIPAHYIQTVVCEHNGTKVFSADWGTAVSKDPYLSCKLKGAKAGDKLRLSWTDNKGQSDATEVSIA